MLTVEQLLAQIPSTAAPIYAPSDLCPCESGLAVQHCPCLYFGVAPARSASKGLVGYRNPACYANVLADCSFEMTREHYLLPKHVLQRSRSREILVTGHEWQRDERTVQSVGVDTLTARVLCLAHNNRLGPLDKQFGRLHQHVTSSARYLMSGTAREFLFNGHDLERWMLKALCGWLAARSKSKKHRRTVTISTRWIAMLFGHLSMPLDCGLYVSITGIDTPPSVPTHPGIPPDRDGISFAPRFQTRPSPVLGEPFHTTFTGCDVTFNGLHLTLSMKPLDVDNERSRVLWRPSELRWYLDGGSGPATSLRLQWREGSRRTVALRTRLEPAR